MNSTPKQWFALHINKGHEKKVVEALIKKGCEYYIPVNRLANKPGEIKKISQPLFPSFVFVRAVVSDHAHLQVMPGVLSMVYWLRKPAIFREVEIDMMRSFMHEHDSVELTKIPVNSDEIVKLEESEALEQEADGSRDKFVQLILPTIGWVLSAEAMKEEVQTLAKASSPAIKFFLNFSIVR